MKNRTIIGVICLVLAIAVTFLVAPLVTRLTTDSIDVPRLNTDVRQGSQITEDMLETVSVKKDSVADGTIPDSSSIIGKYATSNLYAGDYLTEEKLAGEANSADDVFASLDGSKVAVSFTIDSFAAGLSGKLQNGDIISLIVMNNDTGKTAIPAEFTYVKVITASTANGVDKDDIVKNDDGTFEIPSTVTVLVNTTQAKLIAKYEDGYTVQAALVYRGDAETANKFIQVQDEYFESIKGEEIENPETEDETENSDKVTDPVQKANDIINGKADYYDVSEHIEEESHE